MELNNFLFIAVGLVMLIASFYLWARMYQSYINNIETDLDIYSGIVGALGVGFIVTGIFI